MTTQSSQLQLAEGMVIADRFRLIRLLGQGGMGSVWLAHHLTLSVEVAVKFIDTPAGVSAELMSRFTQEAHAAARIKSPHVVQIQDHGTDESGRPYIAMEFLQGEELAQRLDRVGALPLIDVARVVNQTAKGLARAHAAGFVHRDLKPENVFLCDDDDGFLVKILDFGIAKGDSPVGELGHRTGTGQLIGTPMYMSPEQALGSGKVDFRSDLYSLAIVVFRCLTGQPPYDCTGLGELIVNITTQSPPLPSTFRADLPPAIDDWFRRATARAPEGRYGSAKEMADAFMAAIGATDGISGPASLAAPASFSMQPPAVSARSPSSRPNTLVGSATEDTLPQHGKPPRPALLYIVALVAAVAGAAIVVALMRPTAEPAAPLASGSASSQPAGAQRASAASAASAAAPARSIPPVTLVDPPTASASAAAAAPDGTGSKGKEATKGADGARPPHGPATGGPAAPAAKTGAPTAPTAPATAAPKDYGL
jgi:eukaryotic-like serine/threonine-protein kinase